MSLDLNAYVREMNNEIFLSEHHLNGLYIMLLLKQPTSWDHILPTQDNKDKMTLVMNQRIVQVDAHLNGLLSSYEEKIKSSQISKIQKFMSIFRAKNKSMYIHIQRDLKLRDKNQESNEIQKIQQKGGIDTELMGIFYGISNINSLSGMGLGTVSEFNMSERYITFKMGRRYNLTIKNDDPVYRDTSSTLSRIPKQLFVHHILPFFGAFELFGLRGVCKQWEVYVKDAWHGSFKRQMYSQLLASELCKDIEFYYKLLQMRNPFYQKMILLLHALIELILWEPLIQSIQNDTIPFSLKRVLLVMLLLLGQKLPIPNLNSITQSVWNTHKHLTLNIKERITGYFSNLTNSVLSIDELKAIKHNFLDNPFMRVEQLNGDDKTPLLLFIFIKQFLFQSIIKNHIILTQEYLGLSKNKLDLISKEWPTNQRFLEGAYKVLLLKGRENETSDLLSEERTHPDFSALLKSVLENSSEEYQSPDFTIKSKTTITNVYLDKRTKWDIILSTLKKTEADSQQVENNEQQPALEHTIEQSKHIEVQTEQYPPEQPVNQTESNNQETDNKQSQI